MFVDDYLFVLLLVDMSLVVFFIAYTAYRLYAFMYFDRGAAHPKRITAFFVVFMRWAPVGCLMPTSAKRAVPVGS